MHEYAYNTMRVHTALKLLNFPTKTIQNLSSPVVFVVLWNINYRESWCNLKHNFSEKRDTDTVGMSIEWRQHLQNEIFS